MCARRALASLGFEACPIVAGDGGAPAWPAGAVGSISHTAGHCAVVVARRELLLAVGLEVEEDRELAPRVVEEVCTARERRALAAGGSRGRDAVVRFAAKEAFHGVDPVPWSLSGWWAMPLDVPGDSPTNAVRRRVRLPAAAIVVTSQLLHACAGARSRAGNESRNSVGWLRPASVALSIGACDVAAGPGALIAELARIPPPRAAKVLAQYEKLRELFEFARTNPSLWS